MGEYRYAVVTCPHCRKQFIILLRWRKRVRCRFCGRSFKPDVSKASLFRTRDEAARRLYSWRFSK